MTEEQIKKATEGFGLALHAYLDIDEWYFSSHERGECEEMVHESLPWPSDWPDYITVAEVTRRGFIVD